MPIMEISVVPIGTRTTSVSKYVAASEKVLRKEKKARFQITAMGTIVEADSLDKLLAIAGKMHREILSAGAKRALTSIKIDERLDKKMTIQGKVSSVLKKLENS